MVSDNENTGRTESLANLISQARLSPYLEKSNGNLRSAIKLYQSNIELSGAVYETLHVVEVVLRNTIDLQLATWNGTQTNRETSQPYDPDWLLDPSPLLQRLLHRDIERARRNAVKAVARRVRDARTPNHNDVLAQLSFGTWRFLMPGKDPGRQLLWREAIHLAFPYLQSDKRVLELKVQGVHQLRNRVAHLEPLLSPDFVETEFANMRFILAVINPEMETWMVSRQRVTSILRRQQMLPPGGQRD